MKTLPCAKLVFTTILAVFSATSLFARIGEKKEDIQNRMLTKTGGAFIYPSKEERLREAMELPYKYMFLLMPEDVKHSFFFKRSDTETTTTSDTIQQHELYGWEMNLALKGDTSVMEFYRRHGDPITKEEIIELFNLQKKENAHWKKSTFINATKSWNISIKDGKPSYAVKDSKNIADILPTIEGRLIYMEIPEDVRKSTDYSQSLQAQIMEYEQRITYANYRKYLDKKSDQKAAKTKKVKKTGMPAANSGARKIIAADGYTHRYAESEFFAPDNATATRLSYSLEDVFISEKPLTSPTKEVRITKKIPNQPDTAFGYSYETSDGTVRAKLYRNGVLFIDAKFDKALREYMEKLYEKQSEQRVQNAKNSVTKF